MLSNKVSHRGIQNSVKRQFSLLRRVKAREATPLLALDLAPLLGVMLAIL
jgi:hypothetical protein